MEGAASQPAAQQGNTSRGRLLRVLFFTTFYISSFTFGGGFVIVTFMKRKFVDELHWIDEKEMLDFTALAQSCPGAIAVNAAILVGCKVCGLVGMAVAVLGTILPPMILLSVIAVFYEAFQDNQYFVALMTGMQAGVAAVIADVVMKMSLGVVKGRDPVAIVTMAAAFVASYFLDVNVILLILICGVVGYLNYLYKKKQAEKRGAAK